MRPRLRTVLISIAIVVGTCSVWLLLPWHPLLDLLGFEQPIAECQIPTTNSVVRVYEGNGGATTALSYVVTFQAHRFAREHDIFYAYGWPVARGVRCRSETITLVTIDKPLSFSVDKVQHELVDDPLYYYRGQLRSIDAP